LSANLPNSAGVATLLSMCFVGEQGWIASAYKGEIYHTPDGGGTFEVQSLPNKLYAVAMRDASEGYAGGENGTFLKCTRPPLVADEAVHTTRDIPAVVGPSGGVFSRKDAEARENLVILIDLLVLHCKDPVRRNRNPTFQGVFNAKGSSLVLTAQSPA